MSTATQRLVTIGLEGDRIWCWHGFLLRENRTLERQARKRMSDGQSRFVMCVPTVSPDVVGGDYLNRHLLALIHDALNACDVVAVREFQDTDAHVAVIARGCFGDDEVYSLVNREKSALRRIGMLGCWQDTAGVREREYSDAFVLDMVVTSDVVTPVERALQRLCREARVPLTRVQ